MDTIKCSDGVIFRNYDFLERVNWFSNIHIHAIADLHRKFRRNTQFNDYSGSNAVLYIHCNLHSHDISNGGTKFVVWCVCERFRKRDVVKFVHRYRVKFALCNNHNVIVSDADQLRIIVNHIH